VNWNFFCFLRISSKIINLKRVAGKYTQILNRDVKHVLDQTTKSRTFLWIINQQFLYYIRTEILKRNGER
jgi:hypothetical protein